MATREQQGRAAWTVLHSWAYGVRSPQDAKRYVLLCESVVRGLPCTECRQHAIESKAFKNLIRETVDVAASLSVVSRESVDLRVAQDRIALSASRFHSEVNRRLAKKEVMVWDAETLRRFYGGGCESCAGHVRVDA